MYVALLNETSNLSPSGNVFRTSITLFFILSDNSTVDAPLRAYIPIPTVFKFKSSLLWALNKVFSETGPNSNFAIFSSLIILFFVFFIGILFIEFISF